MWHHFWLEDMVRWARGKQRGVRFLGLKENEEKERRAGERDKQVCGYDYYRPTPTIFLEGGR